MRISPVAITLLALHGTTWATSCGVPPPCALIHPHAVLFSGKVEEIVATGHPDEQPWARVSVKEALVGLGPSEREVWVRQNWLKQGQEYFLDLWRGDEGALLWGICNSSSDLDRETSETVQKIRAIRGKNSSWSVWLHLDESEAPGKQLALDGPAGIRKGTTDREGRLNFKNLKPGRYRLRSLIKHYSFDEADSEFELLGGSCPSEYPRGDPNGIKTDANGVVVALGLELVGYRVYAGFYEGRPLWDWQTSPNLYIPPGAEPLDLTLQVRPMMESRR